MLLGVGHSRSLPPFALSSCATVREESYYYLWRNIIVNEVI